MSKKYDAGVKEYRDTYWTPEYVPLDTDLLACFKCTGQEGVPREEVAAAFLPLSLIAFLLSNAISLLVFFDIIFKCETLLKKLSPKIFFGERYLLHKSRFNVLGKLQKLFLGFECKHRIR